MYNHFSSCYVTQYDELKSEQNGGERPCKVKLFICWIQGVGQLCLSGSCLSCFLSLYSFSPSEHFTWEAKGTPFTTIIKKSLSSISPWPFTRPGIHLASKSSQPSINQSIERSICLHFSLLLKHPAENIFVLKN